MPLVERYNDCNITDGSFDDPHTLDFDHRIEAETASFGTGFADVEEATCVITLLRPEFGWTQVGRNWVYDPTGQRLDLQSIWRNNLAECVEHDKNALMDCFCNVATNPATAYLGPKAQALHDKMDTLEWPSETTEMISRFPTAGQYMIGPKFCSAYHLGGGYVGTAGHCLDEVLVHGQLGELRVVFNWIGSVTSKRMFTDSEIFEIEKVVLCDTTSPADPFRIDAWSRGWDCAILKLISTQDQLSHLKSAKYAAGPPDFGTPVYNIGSPLGTQLKVSARAHVLRHSLTNDGENPFSHQIASHGTFTTDLDQFKGNSGGPVFDANTGYIVGHTSSTQDAVAESSVDAIESWAIEHASDSENYAYATDINYILEKQEPNNKLYRVNPKFLRTLSGKPGDSPLMKCATCICPGDLGPNGVMQTPGRYQAVFSRHHFDSKDVYLKNVTARVDRNAIFMTSLNILFSNCDACILNVKFAGKTEVFQKPDISSALIFTGSVTSWNMQHLNFHKDTGLSVPSGIAMWSVTLDIAARRNEIPAALLNASLANWTKVRLEQPFRNPPLLVGLNLSVRRPSFALRVSKTWPPDRPDVTNDPADVNLKWPEETFEYATTAGKTSGTPQTGGRSKPAMEGDDIPGLWTWEAPLDRVWTNPKQPSQGLRDGLMDDIDDLLA